MIAIRLLRSFALRPELPSPARSYQFFFGYPAGPSSDPRSIAGLQAVLKTRRAAGTRSSGNRQLTPTRRRAGLLYSASPEQQARAKQPLLCSSGYCADRDAISHSGSVGFRRVAGDHVEIAYPRQVGDDVLGQSIGQAGGRLVPIQVASWPTAVRTASTICSPCTGLRRYRTGLRADALWTVSLSTSPVRKITGNPNCC